MSNEKLKNKLRERFKDAEYAHAYMETFVNAAIATQIKVLREQRGLTQGELAELTSMKQERISVLENVDYGAWNVKTLRRLAEAFDVVLTVSFETFNQAIEEVSEFSREALQRTARHDNLSDEVAVIKVALNQNANPKSANLARFEARDKSNFTSIALLGESWGVAIGHPTDLQKAESFKEPPPRKNYASTSAAMAMEMT